MKKLVLPLLRVVEVPIIKKPIVKIQVIPGLTERLRKAFPGFDCGFELGKKI